MEFITKDQFFSIVAHDLRNPIGSIKTMTQMLSDEFDHLSQYEAQEFIQRILRLSESAFELLENLLEWYISQNGSLYLKPDLVDVYDIVSRKIDLFIEDARRKNVQLISNIKPDTIVFADPRILKTIIRNLVSNAVKFTPSGGEVTLSSNAIENHVEIAVIDTGIGISLEDQAKLFIFNGYHRTRGTNNESGMGLGLKMCKTLIEKSGGHIRVQSELGIGSRFIFTLPQSSESQK